MPLGHVHTYYDGHGPDYPWREQKRALEMAKAVYDRLNVYAKQRGVKAPKATWDDIEKDIKELMAVSINDTLSAADQKKFKDGNSKLSQRDTNARIAAWKKAIKDRFGTGVDYSFQDADTWRSTVFKEAANNLKPPKDFIPSFTDVDGFIDWYKKAYEALKEREPIVGDKNWFRLLKNVYDNLNAKD